MDDIGKAFIMGTQTLMFVLALTVSIYLYNTLTNSIDSVMLANNYSNRGDAIVDSDTVNTKRTATKAEVVMAILDLKSKYEKTGDDEYYVHVNGNYFKYDKTSSIIKAGNSKDSLNITIEEDSYGRSKLLSAIGSDDSFTLTYSDDEKILEYN